MKVTIPPPNPSHFSHEHQPERNSKGKRNSRKPFRAIDGESFTIEGVHTYTLLMCSDGRHIFDSGGLSTRKCFDFLLELGKDAIHVAFGLNYDVNMILRDFGRARLEELWKDGFTTWFDYEIEWIPGKWFGIKKGIRAERRSIKIYETFGFYQTSFVNALKKWNIPVQDELATMKGLRSDFTPVMVDRIKEYCRTECELLVQLMDELRNALDECGIQLQNYSGAGSIAAAIYKRNKVTTYKKDHDEIKDQILRAYFGGRTELYLQGEFPRAYQYDIVSAYPFATLSLPNLCYPMDHSTSFVRDAKFSIWRVRWDVNSNIPPFPFRYKGKTIGYPQRGEGWYHYSEVAAALDIFGDSITVMEGYYLPVDDGIRPFSFVEGLAKEKVRYKREGNPAEKILKLGINSLYGKLAQGKGYKGRQPTYQSYWWAGAITSDCRARMLRLAHDRPGDVIMIATDGIFLRSDPNWQSGINLGDLERTELHNLFTVQPGVYCAEDAEGNELKKSRGFFAREIDFDELKEGFRQHGPYYTGHYSSTRFHGLGTSLQTKEMAKWRKWVTADRKISMYPNSRFIEWDDKNKPTGPIAHLPIRECASGLSLSYTIKGGSEDLESDKTYVQGFEQPMRETI